jgi:hypothetical protein
LLRWGMRTTRISKAGYRISRGHAAPFELFYGVTDMVSVLLTTVPMVAVIFTLPAVVTVEALVTTPADTVARLVLLEVHVATSVTGKSPLHVTAVAVNVSVKLLPVNGEALVGIWIWLMHPTVTVTVCVPVAAGF